MNAIEIKRRIFINATRHWAFRHVKNLHQRYHEELRTSGARIDSEHGDWLVRVSDKTLPIRVDESAQLWVGTVAVACPRSGRDQSAIEAAANEFRRAVAKWILEAKKTNA